MSNDTVTIDRIDLNADDLEAALEAVEDDAGESSSRIAIVGSVVARGDGWADGDTYVANVEDVSAATQGRCDGDWTGRHKIDWFRDEIDAQTAGMSFTAYLEGQADDSYLDSSSQVEESDHHDYDATLDYERDGNLFLTAGEVRGLAGDPNVGLGKIKYGKLYLTDERDD